MILRRLMTPSCMRRGMDMISCSTPSMRKRIISSLACGSKWMSLAASSTDCAMIELTSLTIGASSVASRMSAIVVLVAGQASFGVLVDDGPVAVDLGDRPVDVFFAGDRRLDAEAGDDLEVLRGRAGSAGRPSRPAACCRRGSGRARRRSAAQASRRCSSAAAASNGVSLRSRKLTPNLAASALARSSSVRTPSSMRSWPRRLCVSFWRATALSICSSLASPMSLRMSPRRSLEARWLRTMLSSTSSVVTPRTASASASSATGTSGSSVQRVERAAVGRRPGSR